MMAAGKVSKFAEGVPSMKLNLKRNQIDKLKYRAGTIPLISILPVLLLLW